MNILMFVFHQTNARFQSKLEFKTVTSNQTSPFTETHTKLRFGAERKMCITVEQVLKVANGQNI